VRLCSISLDVCSWPCRLLVRVRPCQCQSSTEGSYLLPRHRSARGTPAHTQLAWESPGEIRQQQPGAETQVECRASRKRGRLAPAHLLHLIPRESLMLSDPDESRCECCSSTTCTCNTGPHLGVSAPEAPAKDSADPRDQFALFREGERCSLRNCANRGRATYPLQAHAPRRGLSAVLGCPRCQSAGHGSGLRERRGGREASAPDSVTRIPGGQWW